MKYFLLLISLLPAAAWSSVGDLCNLEQDPISFITDWNSGSSKTKLLSTQDGKEFLIDHGRILYVGDLNNDGNDDFIFEASTGVGSSGDQVFSFLLQCHGYLKLLGADYFAKVEVVEKENKQKNYFKEIKIYSYKRNSDGSIQHKGGMPLTTPHIWKFNVESQKYEGKSK
ncbi:hypothetical protein [Pseudomonas sp. Ant30-3]|uniref:hypothetical protein n=1 Tax=Pseudomonas sp. Ant30-3 TaxID=1488328 RepID=UPI0005195383|nr:hypothetical protein [Pseudomonas sp. Ant30-3]